LSAETLGGKENHRVQDARAEGNVRDGKTALNVVAQPNNERRIFGIKKGMKSGRNQGQEHRGLNRREGKEDKGVAIGSNGNERDGYFVFFGKREPKGKNCQRLGRRREQSKKTRRSMQEGAISRKRRGVHAVSVETKKNRGIAEKGRKSDVATLKR